MALPPCLMSILCTVATAAIVFTTHRTEQTEQTALRMGANAEACTVHTLHIPNPDNTRTRTHNNNNNHFMALFNVSYSDLE